MKEQILFTIVLIHFLADFGLQTHDQATKKSTSLEYLFYHVSVYSIIWFIASYYLVFNNIKITLLFTLLTFLLHFTTDYFTSRTSKTFFDNEDFHNGFVVVGFDQMLHFFQLYYTIKFLL